MFLFHFSKYFPPSLFFKLNLLFFYITFVLVFQYHFEKNQIFITHNSHYFHKIRHYILRKLTIPFFMLILKFLFGVKNLFPTLLLISTIISSICTFSICFVVPNIFRVIYNINLFRIAIFNFENSFAFIVIPFSVSFSKTFSYAFTTSDSIKSCSSVVILANLFKDSIIFGLNSFFTYGITIF